jgi:hypothetical protein
LHRLHAKTSPGPEGVHEIQHDDYRLFAQLLDRETAGTVIRGLGEAAVAHHVRVNAVTEISVNAGMPNQLAGARPPAIRFLVQPHGQFFESEKRTGEVNVLMCGSLVPIAALTCDDNRSCRARSKMLDMRG